MASLQSKHPAPSRPLVLPPAPDISFTACKAQEEDVAQALSTFYNGSAAGLDGIRPSHLKELTSSSAGDNGRRLLTSLTNLCNFLLSGRLNVEVCPFLYGAALCALSKKDGGVRPIAIGSTIRRLTTKLGCRAVKEDMSTYLRPRQLGFGTKLGCEAAIHAIRAFVMDPQNENNVIIKLDLKNAFNSVERDVLLAEVRDKIPSLYPFLYQVYERPSNLFHDKDLILSQVGAQQGDPLGPLVFSLSIHKAVSELKSPLNIWYLDDGTLGGNPDVVEHDVQSLLPRLRELGLEVNTNKCEFFPCSTESRSSLPLFHSLLPGLKELDKRSFNLLGSPIFLRPFPKLSDAEKGS
ncbi:reverse transcriptase (RNA-dependent DNA polymerase) domain-containing protein [Phthorimaea operculella]|nr:reverse transcriptase (RNA-dependent DNA polymerase) domain-containing protein [Phthorimaea operculella]